MPKQPRQRLRNLKVNEVSLVDEGDNPGAHILLFKRRRTARNRPGQPGYDPKRRLSKLTVTTSEADGHTHPLELPDGPIAGGTFRTGEVDGHTHDVVLSDLAPGQSTEAVTSPGPNGHTHDVSITAANAVTRRRNGGIMGLLDKVYALLGREASDEEVEKALFDEIRAESMNEQITEALMNRIGDFARSVRTIMFSFGEDEVTDKQGAIAESLGQFVDNMNEEAGDIFAGRITKAFDGVEVDAADEEVEALIAEALGLELDSKSADDAANREEEGMDLSKLSKEDREKVEAALAAAGSVEKLQEQLDAQTEEIAKLKADAEGDGDGKDDDVLKSLPEDVQKAVREQLAERDEENAAMRKRLDTLEKQRQRDAFAKSVGNVEGLPESREDIIDTLWAIPDEETRKKVQKQLEASAEAVRRGQVFEEFGSGLEGGGGDAYAKAESMARQLMEKDSNLTLEMAKQRVFNENPDLYDEYIGETQ